METDYTLLIQTIRHWVNVQPEEEAVVQALFDGVNGLDRRLLFTAPGEAASIINHPSEPKKSVSNGGLSTRLRQKSLTPKILY